MSKIEKNQNKKRYGQCGQIDQVHEIYKKKLDRITDV